MNNENNIEQIKTLKKRVAIFLEDGDWESAKEYCNRLLDIDPENQNVYLLLTLAENEVKDVEGLLEKRIDVRQTKHYKRIVNGPDKETLETIESAVSAYEEIVKKDKYDMALEFQQKNTEPSLKKAIALFTELSGYLDVDERKKQCEKALPAVTNKKQKQLRIGVASIIGILVFILVIINVAKASGYYPCNVKWGDSFDTVLKKAAKCSSEDLIVEDYSKISTDWDVPYLGLDGCNVYFTFEQGANGEPELIKMTVNDHNTNIRPFIKKYGKNIDEVTSEHFIWYKEKETIELRYNGLNGNTGDTKNITVYMKKK